MKACLAATLLLLGCAHTTASTAPAPTPAPDAEREPNATPPEPVRPPEPTSRTPEQAVSNLPPCRELPRPSLLVGSLRLTPQACTQRACPAAQACCNACSWKASLVDPAGAHTLEPKAVRALLGGPPEDARDCDLAEWSKALQGLRVGVSGLPLEGGAQSVAARPRAMCLEASDR